MQSNMDYWNRLLNDGKLFSLLKDGPPHGAFEYCIAFAYPIILACMIVMGIIFFRRAQPSEKKWKTYVFSITCGSFLGGIWCCIMQKYDPRFPGWLFAPWSIIGPDFGLTLEDWIFLPASTTLFYIVYRKLSIAGHVQNASSFHVIVMGFYGLLSVIVFIVTGVAGKTEIIMFMAPALLLYLYARKNIDIKKFIILQLFILFFEVGWDLFAVSLLHSIPGFSWASGWSYILFDANGQCYHSSIFLNYTNHRWAWLLMNPIEITPLFGICGGILNYAMFAAGDKYFYNDTGK
jgi:hypothetical protein